MTNPTSPMLEKAAEAAAEAYADQFARRAELGAAFDPAKASVIAALTALKDLDEGTVEAMKVAFTKSLMADEPRNGLASAFTAAINHILRSGEG